MQTEQRVQFFKRSGRREWLIWWFSRRLVWNWRLKKVVNFFREEKCTPEKILVTPI